MNTHNRKHRKVYKELHNNITMNIHSKAMQDKILRFLGKKRVITSSELARYLKVSWNTAEKYLLELVIEKKVEKIKKEGVNLWVLQDGED